MAFRITEEEKSRKEIGLDRMWAEEKVRKQKWRWALGSGESSGK